MKGWILAGSVWSLKRNKKRVFLYYFSNKTTLSKLSYQIIPFLWLLSFEVCTGPVSRHSVAFYSNKAIPAWIKSANQQEILSSSLYWYLFWPFHLQHATFSLAQNLLRCLPKMMPFKIIIFFFFLWSLNSYPFNSSLLGSRSLFESFISSTHFLFRRSFSSHTKYFKDNTKKTRYQLWLITLSTTRES